MTQGGGSRTALAAAGLVLAAVMGGAQAVQAWTGWRGAQAAALPPAVADGTLCSVILVNGLVFYGDCIDGGSGHVGLRDIYYVETLTAPPGGVPGNRLVSRRKADWHAPQQMSIPIDKVMLVESSGRHRVWPSL